MPEIDELDAEVIEQWRGLAEDGRRQAAGLPVDRVVALGTRRHRRRLVSQAAVVAVVVVALVGGGVVVQDQLPWTRARPAAPPPTAISAGFPITQDPPDRSRYDRVVGPGANIDVRRFSPCEPRLLGSASASDWILVGPDNAPAESVAVRYESSSFEQIRLVQRFGSVEAAQRVITEVVDAVERCPREDIGGGVVAIYSAHMTEVGDEAVMVRTQWNQDGSRSSTLSGVEMRSIVRVGSVVFMVSTLDYGATDQNAEDELKATLSQLSESFAARLCEFGDDAC